MRKFIRTVERFTTRYPPQTPEVVEIMNSIARRTLRCPIPKSDRKKNWERLLATVEMTTNPSPKSITS